MVNKSNYLYQINLPGYTDKNVIEWFEKFSNSNRLSEEIIALVFELVYSSENTSFRPSIKEESKPHILETTKIDESSDDFFSNLYNWQDSNSMIHSDENRREKKKMLSV